VMAKLEELGELDNTVIIVTGDNGMPFPRAKTNLYDYGTRMPLAVRWPARVKGGRVIDDFISFTDFAELFFISALHGSSVGKLYGAINRAYESATKDLSTPELTRILEKAVESHQPPLVQGRRIKLLYDADKYGNIEQITKEHVAGLGKE